VTQPESDPDGETTKSQCEMIPTDFADPMTFAVGPTMRLNTGHSSDTAAQRATPVTCRHDSRYTAHILILSSPSTRSCHF